MTIRLILLTLFTSTTILLASFRTDIGQTILIFLSVFGVVAIAETIRTFKKIELVGNILTLRQSFSRTQSFKLEQITDWNEHHYYIRGQLKKSLVLFLRYDQRLEIAIYDDVVEFEKLEQYLKVSLPKPKAL